MHEVCLTSLGHESRVRRTGVTVNRGDTHVAFGDRNERMASGRRSVIELTSQQAARQRARRAAIDPAMSARIQSALRDQRVSRLATRLSVTLARRDQAIERWDRRIREVLVQLTRVERLTIEEALAWSGATLTKGEARRLRQLAEHDSGPTVSIGDEPHDPSTV